MQSLPSKLSLALWSWGCSNPPIRHTVIIFIWPDTRTRRFVDCQSQQSLPQDREGAKAIDLRWWLWQLPKQLGQEVANLIGIAKSDFLWRRQARVGYNRSLCCEKTSKLCNRNQDKHWPGNTNKHQASPGYWLT